MGYIDEKTGLVVEWNTHMAKVKGDKDKETPEGDSMTVPDKSFTVQEILERFTRGVKLDVQFKGTYDEADFDQLNPFENPDFDYSDIDTLVLRYKQMVTTTKAEKESIANSGEVVTT